MQRVAAAATTIFLELKPSRRGFLILCRHVIALFALRALQNNVISRHNSLVVSGQWPVVSKLHLTTLTTAFYSTISLTVPAPTVLPPSRIAKRSPFSIAMGAISVISIWMLSPGITISTPSGRLATPVTSVVLK